MVCSRTPTPSWLWFVPSPGERRTSFYHLWNHPVYGWDVTPPPPFVFMHNVNLLNFMSALVGAASCAVSMLCLFCSPRGAEWWTVQPCSWLVVTGNSAFFIGYWKSEVFSTVVMIQCFFLFFFFFLLELIYFDAFFDITQFIMITG